MPYIVDLTSVSALQWRHNGCNSVSNHQPHDCLLNRLLRRRSKKTSKLHVTGLCVGNSPHKWPVTRTMFPFDDVIMILAADVYTHCSWPAHHSGPSSRSSHHTSPHRSTSRPSEHTARGPWCSYRSPEVHRRYPCSQTRHLNMCCGETTTKIQYSVGTWATWRLKITTNSTVCSTTFQKDSR